MRQPAQAHLGSRGPANSRKEHHGQHPQPPRRRRRPARARPGLALVLALLSIPGSTIAWDLPAGGLWIGLPLAVAAIVLGIRARRQRREASRMALAAIVLATLTIAQMVVYAAVRPCHDPDRRGDQRVQAISMRSSSR